MLEVSQDRRSPDDVADLAGAGGDVLQGAPAAGEHGEPPFAQAAQGALDSVARVSARLPLGMPRRRPASSSFATDQASSLGTSSVAR